MSFSNSQFSFHLNSTSVWIICADGNLEAQTTVMGKSRNELRQRVCGERGVLESDNDHDDVLHHRDAEKKKRHLSGVFEREVTWMYVKNYRGTFIIILLKMVSTFHTIILGVIFPFKLDVPNFWRLPTYLSITQTAVSQDSIFQFHSEQYYHKAALCNFISFKWLSFSSFKV